jgi:hypothetical protein
MGTIAVPSTILKTATYQGSALFQTWLAGLAQGAWDSGPLWLCLEVGTGNNASPTPTSLQTPVYRKYVDNVQFCTDATGATISSTATLFVLISASLQHAEANGYTISEYGIWGGALNLPTAGFGVGVLLAYDTLTPVAKTSAKLGNFPVVLTL